MAKGPKCGYSTFCQTLATMTKYQRSVIYAKQINPLGNILSFTITALLYFMAGEKSTTCCNKYFGNGIRVTFVHTNDTDVLKIFVVQATINGHLKFQAWVVWSFVEMDTDN